MRDQLHFENQGAVSFNDPPPYVRGIKSVYLSVSSVKLTQASGHIDYTKKTYTRAQNNVESIAFSAQSKYTHMSRSFKYLPISSEMLSSMVKNDVQFYLQHLRKKLNFLNK